MTIRISRCAFAASLALALCFARSPELFAAEPEVLFEDDFTELDSSFESTGGDVKSSVEDHNLVITASKPTWGTKDFYQSSVFTEADITVQVRLPEPEAEKGAEAGIGFWALNYSEFYAFVISDSGTVAVYSTNGKRWVYPVAWTRSSALKTGADEWNEMRVVTVGNWATLYLNNKKIASIKGKPPEGGGLMGPLFYAGSEAASARFSQLKVVVPTGTDAIPPEETPADPNLLFSDNFATFDPCWGTESGIASVKDNKFLIKPQLDYGYHFLNGAALVTDVDMSAKVRINDNDPKSTCTAGLVFWAQSDDDFFVLQIADDGSVGVDRLLKGRWLSPMPYKPAPTAAKVQPSAETELRVVTNGKKATCYVNGVAVGSITGQPIKGDWQFGMFAQSGKTPAIGEFSSLKVLKPAAAAK